MHIHLTTIESLHSHILEKKNYYSHMRYRLEPPRDSGLFSWQSHKLEESIVIVIMNICHICAEKSSMQQLVTFPQPGVTRLGYSLSNVNTVGNSIIMQLLSVSEMLVAWTTSHIIVFIATQTLLLCTIAIIMWCILCTMLQPQWQNTGQQRNASNLSPMVLSSQSLVACDKSQHGKSIVYAGGGKVSSQLKNQLPPPLLSSPSLSVSPYNPRGHQNPPPYTPPLSFR